MLTDTMQTVNNHRKICTILFYSWLWEMDETLTEVPRKDGFTLTTDRSALRQADVVLFHMPTLGKAREVLRKENKRPDQLWVFWSMECELHYPWQYDPAMLSLFDIHMDYKVDSDVPIPYIYSVYDEWMRREPVVKTELVNAFISSNDDKSGRVACLKELMTYLDVHSYGKVLRNRALPDDSGMMAKAHTIATYKFSLAIENAVAKDYVTEKFFHPLIMGSVPVYLGAPNVAEFAPGDHCYIDVKDFGSIRELADHLLMLDRCDNQYAAYLDWKNKPYREPFRQKLAATCNDPFVRLYDLLEKRLFL